MHTAQLLLYKKTHGGAWLGRINLASERRVLWQWDGHNEQGAHFVIPAYDADLEAMLVQRYRTEYQGVEADTLRVRDILERIGVLGGEMLELAGR